MAQVAYNKHRKEFEDIILPPQGQKWGGLNKYDTFSRWTIPMTDFDDLVNYLPEENQLRQMPAPSLPICQLPAPVINMNALSLNSATFIFCLCQNGHLYQVSTGGIITDIGGGFSNLTDYAAWQGTDIIISDVMTAKVFDWNGVTLTTVFTSQPASFVAIFAGRLWMAHNNTVTFTAAGTFNSLGGDAGSFVIGDQDTASLIVAMQPFLGQLYVFGPDWIQTIGGLFDTGFPAVLQFQRYTLENQIGPINKYSIIERGSFLYFANSYGFWQLAGLDPTDIGSNLDGFFQGFTALSSFSAAFGQIYGNPVMMWHANWSGDGKNSLFIYADKKWCRWTGNNVTFVTNAVDQSNGLQTIWGTDSLGNIFSMFTNQSTPVTSNFQLGLMDFGHPVLTKSGEYVGITNIFTSSATATATLIKEDLSTLKTNTVSSVATLQFINSSGKVLQFVNNLNQTLSFSTAATIYTMHQFGFEGFYRALSLNYSVTGVGCVVAKVTFQTKPTTAAFGN